MQLLMKQEQEQEREEIAWLVKEEDLVKWKWKRAMEEGTEGEREQITQLMVLRCF